MTTTTGKQVRHTFSVQMIVSRRSRAREAYRAAFALSAVAASARRFSVIQVRAPVSEELDFHYSRDGRALIFDYIICFTHDRQWQPNEIKMIDPICGLAFMAWSDPDVCPDSPQMVLNDADTAADVEDKVIAILREHVPGLESLE